ncbi:MAG: site-specific integrase [Clostridium sp.]
MASAKKLKSGSWRCLVYDYTDANKKRHYESFTAETKKEAEYMAAEFAVNKKVKKCENASTFGECLDDYISRRTNVLSPRSIYDYRRLQRTDMLPLKEVKISDITQDIVQEFINKYSKTHAPKTVRDIHGLVSAVLKEARPDFALNTMLPKNVRTNLYIPSDDDIRKLLDYAAGTELELPILLAAFGPMRRGEICALDSKNINGNIVHVVQNMVINENKQWVIKTPKSFAGNRFIAYPDFVADKFSDINGRITNISPDVLTSRFSRLLKRSGIEHFRFHDLRHYSASVQHAIGIPDAYIMERGGWGNDGVLKNVYRHTMSEKKVTVDSTTNDYFSKLCNTKYNTKK